MYKRNSNLDWGGTRQASNPVADIAPAHNNNSNTNNSGQTWPHILSLWQAWRWLRAYLQHGQESMADHAYALLRANILAEHEPHYEQQLLQQPSLRALAPLLRRDFGRTEALREARHAQRLLQASTALNRYSLYGNYVELVASEVKLLPTPNNNAHNQNAPLVFIGAGPLPLTALMLADLTQRKIIGLDCDEHAIELGRDTIARLSATAQVQLIHCRGEDFDYAQAGAVWLASLVPQKQAIMQQIKATAPHTPVIARTAQGLSQMLYTAFPEDAAKALGYKLAERSPRRQMYYNTSLLFLPARFLPA